MTNCRENSSTEYHTVQAERDLGANWEVDLAKKLEDYLLKICSGEITGVEDDSTSISVNFAEAALLLQGSVQVYSRKVEYLYNLVLHALDFLSQKRQEEHFESSSTQPEQNDSNAISNEENDQFWVSDDIPVEARNCIDASTSKDASFYHFVKPPANLIVLEGDCLDSIGDGGELESYLLASNDLYRDFILLDLCDAEAVTDFLEGDDIGKGQNSAYRASSGRKSFQSPAKHSGGTACKSSIGKNRDANIIRTPIADCKLRPDNPANDTLGDSNHGFDMDDGHSEPMNFEDSDDNDDDDADPWEPLNPHEPGNLKVKPFRKVKANRRNGVNTVKQTSITTLFPLARMRGTISPELIKIWEEQCSKSKKNRNSNAPPLYEKLRESLCNKGIYYNTDTFGNAENGYEDNVYDNGIPDFEPPDEEMPESLYMDEDLPPPYEKYGGSSSQFDTVDAFGHDDPSSQASLEDLCRSHLDALLANIAEMENQTELAARVSSWKHKIEHSLEEQDSRQPFDIHAYGERIVEKLSLEADSVNTMSFADVVKGQEKHDVARTFSALLQLVNNGDVSLERSGVVSESICYTATNPFRVKLLDHDKRQDRMQFRFSKKRVISAIKKGRSKGDKFEKETSPLVISSQCGATLLPSQRTSKFSAKLGKVGSARCTPEGKRRRRSRILDVLNQ